MKRVKIIVASLALCLAVGGAFAVDHSRIPPTLFEQTPTDCIPLNCHENPNDGGIACDKAAFRVDLGTTCDEPVETAYKAQL